MEQIIKNLLLWEDRSPSDIVPEIVAFFTKLNAEDEQFALTAYQTASFMKSRFTENSSDWHTLDKLAFLAIQRLRAIAQSGGMERQKQIETTVGADWFRSH